jgi:hypothetical protein
MSAGRSSAADTVSKLGERLGYSRQVNRKTHEGGLVIMVDIAKMRWRIEPDYQDLKQEIGLGHYKGRGWRVTARCVWPPMILDLRHADTRRMIRPIRARPSPLRPSSQRPAARLSSDIRIPNVAAGRPNCAPGGPISRRARWCGRRRGWRGPSRLPSGGAETGPMPFMSALSP